MKKFNLLLLLVVLPFAGQTILAQGMNSEKIDALAQQVLETTPSVGFSIAVVKDGKVIHSKGYGIKSIEIKENVDEHTLFAIASNSKAFTSAALSILVDEGKLNWQDKVVKHIPEFKMYNDYVTANFTIEDLLTHRSGLGLGAGDLMIFPDGGDFTITDVLKSFQYQKPTSDFRTKYDYDNLLYIVAGEVVARLSGMSWSDFIQSRIFDPLGMTGAVPTSSRLAQNANLARPHDSEGGKIKLLGTYGSDLVAAAGGIYASVNDLTKWMLMQLNGGKYGEELSKTLFSPAQQRAMWKPHTNTGFFVKANPQTGTHFMAYGLGWGIKDQKGKIVISHTGGLPGMLSKTTLVPELNLGIVVLTNSLPGGYGYASIPETILDSYLGIEDRQLIKAYANVAIAQGGQSDAATTAAWEKVEKSSAIEINYKDYTGTYKDNWFGEIEVSLKGQDLWFTSKRSPKLSGKMFFYEDSTFAIKWEYTDMNADAFAIFELNEQGKGMAIKMKGISPNIDFSFDFQDLDLKRVK